MEILEIKELRNKTAKDLVSLLALEREKLRNLRFSVSAKQLKNVKEINGLRKYIARILTVVKEKSEKQQ